MGMATFERLVEEIRGLDTGEQQRLRLLLDAWLTSGKQTPPSEAGAEDRFEHELLEAGIISIPRRTRIPGDRRRFQPIENRGRPISEVIIEERR